MTLALLLSLSEPVLSRRSRYFAHPFSMWRSDCSMWTLVAAGLGSQTLGAQVGPWAWCCQQSQVASLCFWPRLPHGQLPWGLRVRRPAGGLSLLLYFLPLYQLGEGRSRGAECLAFALEREAVCSWTRLGPLVWKVGLQGQHLCVWEHLGYHLFE